MVEWPSSGAEEEKESEEREGRLFMAPTCNHLGEIHERQLTDRFGNAWVPWSFTASCAASVHLQSMEGRGVCSG